MWWPATDVMEGPALHGVEARLRTNLRKAFVYIACLWAACVCMESYLHLKSLISPRPATQQHTHRIAYIEVVPTFQSHEKPQANAHKLFVWTQKGKLKSRENEEGLPRTLPLIRFHSCSLPLVLVPCLSNPTLYCER